MKNGLENHYIVKNNKKLFFGYTTGSCASAAAKAGARMLVTGEKTHSIELMTPKGIKLILPIEDIEISEEFVSCAVRKYSGDDPDVTDGMLIYAKLTKDKKTKQIKIDGGLGVGRITRKGLEQPVGFAAINITPRKMIEEEVTKVLSENKCDYGVKIIISAPGGEEIAKRTFNPRLGIQGGISILGTSGIVEPMSEKAIVDSIKAELKMLKENGRTSIVISPGNYGKDFSKETLDIRSDLVVKCSNYIGETIDMIVELGFEKVVFIGHIGKFVKVAGGIMNTHSRFADSRMEILASNMILAGGDIEGAKKILNCINTDDAIKILESRKLTQKTMENVLRKIEFYIDGRAYGKIDIAVVIFSNRYGVLGRSSGFYEILTQIKES